jgi:hypothetical protein
MQEESAAPLSPLADTQVGSVQEPLTPEASTDNVVFAPTPTANKAAMKAEGSAAGLAAEGGLRGPGTPQAFHEDEAPSPQGSQEPPATAKVSSISLPMWSGFWQNPVICAIGRVRPCRFWALCAVSSSSMR